jgi:esterase/lipase superfamily enzyme
MIIKSKTPLSQKVQTYLRWKHSDKRYVACATALPNGMIKVLTVSNIDSEDYYHEWVSPRTMNLEIKENNL